MVKITKYFFIKRYTLPCTKENLEKYKNNMLAVIWESPQGVHVLPCNRITIEESHQYYFTAKRNGKSLKEFYIGNIYNSIIVYEVG